MNDVKKTAGIGKGTPGPGRRKGVPNRSTASVKAALLEAFDKAGGVDALVKWAKKNDRTRGEFYRLFARLIPIDVNHSGAIDLAGALNSARERIKQAAARNES